MVKAVCRAKFWLFAKYVNRALKGYIGHSVAQRQNIEFFYSKQERRLKKGQKSNLKNLMKLTQMQEVVDKFTTNYLNNRYLDRLGATPNEVFKMHESEAVAVDSFKLSLYMAESLKRKVLKKDIMVNSVWFYNAEIFKYNGLKSS